MRVDEVLERLGGVAAAAELERLASRRKIRTGLRRGRIVRDGHGRYALPGADEELRVAARLNGVLCLQSAARHYGWKLKTQPGATAVGVPRNRKVSAERRRGVRLLYVDLAPGDVRGPATSPVVTVMQCAARLPFDEALAIADSALRAGGANRAQLVAAAHRMPARYRTRCLRVAQAASPLADNPFESVLRAIALEIEGLHVEPQVWIGDTGRADLVDSALGLVVEAESFEFHGKRWQLDRDCERYNAFALEGRLVLRFSWEQVMFRPGYVRAVLRAAVDLLTRGPDRRALEAGDEQASA